MAASPSQNPLRPALRKVRVRLVASRMAADARSRKRLVELLELPRSDSPSEPEPIALKALDGEEIFLRAGSADPDVALGAFFGLYHLPSDGLTSPKLIWDLGSNIGLTMRQMAHAYPGARVVGVELDPDNLELSERNLAPVRERCELVEGAVWPDPGVLHYGTPSGEDAFRVDGTAVDDAAGSATAIPLGELVERFGVPDYVKMDIEGAEAEVLKRNVEWAAGIPFMGVEYHKPYSLDECRADLEALGFDSFAPAERGLLRRGSDSLYASRS